MKGMTNRQRLILASLGGALLVCLILLAFVWPSDTATLKRFPLAIVAPEHVDQMPFMLMYAEHDEFALQTTPTREAAIHLIQQRQVYGAVVLGLKPEVLMASANGDVVSSLMNEVAIGMQERLNGNAMMHNTTAPTVIRSDVVPRLKNTFDLAILSLPLMIGSILGGIASALFMPSRGWRIYFLVGYAALVGVSFTTILHFWLGLVPGQCSMLAGAISLIILSLSSFVSGLYSLIGPPGLGIGAVYTLLLANPIAGLLVPPEVLLEPWGVVGHWLAPGVATRVLYSATYFPEAAAGSAWVGLIAWATLGLVMIVVKYRPAILRV